MLEKIKTLMFRIIDKFYWGEEDAHKLTPAVPVFFLALSAVYFAAFIFASRENWVKSNSIILIYFSCVFLAFAIFFVIMYFFQDSTKTGDNKLYKKVFITLGWFILATVAMPIMILLYLLDKTMFHNIWNHIVIYTIGIFAAFIGGLLVYLIGINIFSKYDFINANILAAFVAFIISNLIVRAAFCFCFKFIKFVAHIRYHKGKLLQEELDRKFSRLTYDYEQAKNEIYIINFLLIAILTFISVCFNFESMANNEIMKGIISAFPLYIAFDRLSDKWKKTHGKTQSANERPDAERTE